MNVVTFSYPAEFYKHPESWSPFGSGPCLAEEDSGTEGGVNELEGGETMDQSVVPVHQSCMGWVFHPRLPTFSRSQRQWWESHGYVQNQRRVTHLLRVVQLVETHLSVVSQWKKG